MNGNGRQQQPARSARSRLLFTYPHCHPGGTNTLLLVRLETDSSTVPSAVTYGGFTMTKANQNTPNDGGLMQTWYLVNPPSGANAVVVSSSDTFSGNSYNVAAIVYAGVNQTSPIGAMAFSNISAASAAWTNGITTTFASSLIDQYLEINITPGTYTPGAAQTNLGVGGGCCHAVDGSYYPAPTVGLYNLTSGFDSSKTGSSDEIEIKGILCPTNTMTPSFSATPTSSRSATLSNTPTRTATSTPTPLMPLVKTVNLGSATMGDTLTFCLNWTNDSNATQTIVVHDTISAYLTYIGCNGGCSRTGSVVTWTNSVAVNGTGQGCFWATVSGYPP